MPVYNGNSKAKDLYYGGTKIKEAYYGGTKVYSSGPLYYCYYTTGSSKKLYLYFSEYPEVGETIQSYFSGTDYRKVSNSSELVAFLPLLIKGVTDTTVTYDALYGGSLVTATRDISGDLYT